MSYSDVIYILADKNSIDWFNIYPEYIEGDPRFISDEAYISSANKILHTVYQSKPLAFSEQEINFVELFPNEPSQYQYNYSLVVERLRSIVVKINGKIYEVFTTDTPRREFLQDVSNPQIFTIRISIDLRTFQQQDVTVKIQGQLNAAVGKLTMTAEPTIPSGANCEVLGYTLGVLAKFQN